MSRPVLLALLVVAVALLLGSAFWVLQDDRAGTPVATGARSGAPDDQLRLPMPASAPAGDVAVLADEFGAGPPPEALHADPGQTDDALRVTDRRAPEPPPALMQRLDLERDGHGVAGRVLDTSGRAIAGAQVSLLVPGWGRSGDQELQPASTLVTGSDGTFALALSPQHDPARARVAVRAPGYGPWFGRLVVAGGSDDVVLAAPRRLLLHVHFEDGSPAVGAEVQLARETVDPDWIGRPHATHDEQTWFTSTTDEEGRAWLALPSGATWTLVRVAHPECGASRRVDLIGDADPFEAEIELRRAPSVEVVLEGDFDAWAAVGQRPSVELQALEFDAAGELVLKFHELGGVVRYMHPVVDGRALFEDVPSTPWRVALGVANGQWRNTGAPELLLDHFTPTAGRSVLRLPLPPPPPFDPDDGWLVQGTVVDANGEPILSDRRPWGRLPSILIEDDMGRSTDASVDQLVRGTYVGLSPPLRVSFQGWPSGPQQADVRPGTPVHLLVDEAALRARTATVTLDLAGIPVADHARVGLELSREDDRWVWADDPAEVGGLLPGEWRWRLSGQPVEPDEGRMTLLAGDVQRLVARPATPREAEAQPPHAVLQGSVTILGDDPWVLPWRVEYEPGDPQSEPSVDPATAGSLVVSHGAFRGALPPGRHRLRAVARRALQPERLTDRGLRPEDAWSTADVSLASPWVELALADGELRDITLEVDARQLGLLFVEVFVEGVPLAQAGTDELPLEARLLLLDPDGKQWVADQLRDPPPGGVSYARPPGPLRVFVEAVDRPDLASWSRAIVMPRPGPTGTPMSLELRVDLVPRRD